jgi:hypothetical protein
VHLRTPDRVSRFFSTQGDCWNFSRKGKHRAGFTHSKLMENSGPNTIGVVSVGTVRSEPAPGLGRVGLKSGPPLDSTREEIPPSTSLPLSGAQPRPCPRQRCTGELGQGKTLEAPLNCSSSLAECLASRLRRSWGIRIEVGLPCATGLPGTRV